nr:MAG TPA: hypothetical protein [Caudoviricetes sp.]
MYYASASFHRKKLYVRLMERCRMRAARFRALLYAGQRDALTRHYSRSRRIDNLPFK